MRQARMATLGRSMHSATSGSVSIANLKWQTSPMPAKSVAQANLMRAAEHGAQFAKAKQLRRSMSLKQLSEFAGTPTKGLPQHVKKS
jgi:hypothetical protein